MITVKRIEKITPEVIQYFGPFAKAEWEFAGMAGPQMVEYSEYVLLVREDDEPLLVTGVARRSPMAQAEVWALVCEKALNNKFVWRKLRKLMAILFDRYPKLQTRVFPSQELSKRFIKFLGFRFLRQDGAFEIYEVTHGSA